VINLVAVRQSVPLISKLISLVAVIVLNGFMLPPSAVLAEPLAFEHVTVIDGTGRLPQKEMTVVTSGERISAVGLDGAVEIPDGARRIDARGQFLIPGMIDLHLHLIGGGLLKASRDPSDNRIPDFDAGLRALQGFLYYGFTSIFDAGNNPYFILPLRRQERAGDIVSPRIFATGQTLSYPGSAVVGYGGIGVRDWPDTIQDIELQLSRKPDLQKITYESRGYGPTPLTEVLPKELMGKMITYLHERDIRTVVHISNERMAVDAIEAGIDTLAHAPHAGIINQEFADMVAARKIPIQTSMAVHWEIAQMVDGLDVLHTPEYRATVAQKDLVLLEKARDRYIKGGFGPYFKLVHEYEKRNLKMIHDAGGILAFGSDRTFGPAALTELELIVSAGITPFEVIKIATLNAAIFLGREEDLGSIEVGKLADLVLLDADPSADIGNVKRTAMVVKGGAFVDRGGLDLPINNRQAE
jgi:imidazolonepropionase-like amidohydrolase